MVSLFAENHCSDLASSSLALSKRLEEFTSEILNVQSSEKSKVNKSVALAKSFMKN